MADFVFKSMQYANIYTLKEIYTSTFTLAQQSVLTSEFVSRIHKSQPFLLKNPQIFLAESWKSAFRMVLTFWCFLHFR